MQTCCLECLRRVIYKLMGKSQKPTRAYRPSEDEMDESTAISMIQEPIERPKKQQPTLNNAAASKKKKLPYIQKSNAPQQPKQSQETEAFGKRAEESPVKTTNVVSKQEQGFSTAFANQQTSLLEWDAHAVETQPTSSNKDNESLFNQPIKKQNTITQKQVEPINEVSETILQSQPFRISLSPQDRYYSLLESKTRDLPSKMLLFPGAVIPISEQPQRKSSTNLQIKHYQQHNSNVFCYSFSLNCSYSFFNAMNSDYQLQRRLDPNIEEYRMVELVATNVRINYLAYKKVLIITPRDYVFLRYTNSWQKNEYWEVNFSVDSQQESSSIGRTRGEIVLWATHVIEDNQTIRVKVYSEIDIKQAANLRVAKTQALSDIRKYVEKCEQYVRNNYRSELV